MAEKLSFDAYLGWVNITNPNNIPQDARVIGANDLLRYEKFGRDATAKINELEASASDTGVAALVADPESETNVALAASIAQQVKATGAGGLQVVEHGKSATTPRPKVTGQVIWIGTVVPANRIAGDMYYKVATEPAPWNPVNDLQNLYGWWQPSSFDGNNLPDSSGNGLTMSHWTTPKLTASNNGLNGTPALVVSTAGASLQALIPPTVGPITVMFNAKVMNSNTGYVVGGATGNTGDFGVFKTGTTQWATRRGLGPTITNPRGADTNIHSVVAVFNGAESRLYVDGQVSAVGTLEAISVGSFSICGRNAGGTLYNGCDVGSMFGDVVVSGSPLNDADALEATGWLRKRIGL